MHPFGTHDLARRIRKHLGWVGLGVPEIGFWFVARRSVYCFVHAIPDRLVAHFSTLFQYCNSVATLVNALRGEGDSTMLILSQ
jgi:hypothetical protein